MNRRTIVLILLLLFAVGLLVLSVKTTLPEKQGNTAKNINVTPMPVNRSLTMLVASPSAGLVDVGEEQDFTVNIDTGGNKVASVQLEMVFNPDYISVKKITPLSFFDNPTVLLNEVDNKTGTISYALGTTEVKTGQGELVQITVVAKKATNGGSTPITFLPKTSVGEIGNPTSVLKNAVGVNFIVNYPPDKINDK